MADEPRSGLEHAQLLMEKAAGDEKALRRLIEDEDIPDDVLGFHAQQAAEKLLKAVLAGSDLGYERTHNIAYLLNELDSNNIPRPTFTEQLPELTPWATAFRYADLPEAALHRQETLALIEQTRNWAETQLPSP